MKMVATASEFHLWDSKSFYCTRCMQMISDTDDFCLMCITRLPSNGTYRHAT